MKYKVKAKVIVPRLMSGQKSGDTIFIFVEEENTKRYGDGFGGTYEIIEYLEVYKDE